MFTPIQVAPNVWRGPQPQDADDWKQLWRLGIKYTLDLETGGQILKDGSPLQEQFTSEAFGIKAFCHPLGTILPPSKDELELAHRTIVVFNPIYIHCKAGVDRTGMVCAHFRKETALSRSQAIAEAKSLGMHWWYYWWAWFL